jgi:hypothetical protein
MSPAPRKKNKLIPVSKVEDEAASRILTVRGQRVVLDSDLAEFYGVETRRLVEQVGRNLDRFPEDFCFELTSDEFANLTSQSEGSSAGQVAVAICLWSSRSRARSRCRECSGASEWPRSALLSPVLSSRCGIGFRYSVASSARGVRRAPGQA